MSKHHNSLVLNEKGLILCGYQKKLKTMKRKFFVLYRETLTNVARLEYFDTEKKFKSGSPPKRVIKLKNCFNINRRLDTKHDFVIVLSTKDGGFGIVMDTEVEMFKWLNLLISLQRCISNLSESNQPHFEHMWQVVIQKKGLAEDKCLFGSYHVGLSQKSLTLLRIGPETTNCGSIRKTNVEFLLTTIRRCGDSQCVFYMEVGRQSIVGPGELWMETEDPFTAQSMHSMILSAMSAKTESNLEPMRKRSSSANEASKPINVIQRRQTQSEHKSHNSPQTNSSFGRERCDSLPSRSRTISENSNQSFTAVSAQNIRNAGLRLHSYSRHSNSPPINNTMGCSESEESSISIDEPDDNGAYLQYRFNSRSSKGIIPEENTDELASSDSKGHECPTDCDTNCPSSNLEDQGDENYVSMAPVKATKDLLETGNKDGPKYFVPNSLHKHGTDIDFPEYTSDASKAAYVNEVNLQSELPARTYSVGNKIEHNIKRNFGNLNDTDHNTVRVRAFSVGSRAKIPRCDLQRGALFPKSAVEQSFNSSNNNISSVYDIAPYKQLLNISTGREKKSTSAPLLLHKSQNSVDRMSDLMEIDFSKSSTNIKNKTAEALQNQLSKNTTSTSQTLNREQIKKYDITNQHSCDEPYIGRPTVLPTANMPSPATSNVVATTDNGYLEMKPVGNFIRKSSPIRLPPEHLGKSDILPNTPKMPSALEKTTPILTPFSNINPTVLANKLNAANSRSINHNKNLESAESDLLEQKEQDNFSKYGEHEKKTHCTPSSHSSNIQTSCAFSASKESALLSKYAKLSLKTSNSALTESECKPVEDDYINIGYNEIQSSDSGGNIKSQTNNATTKLHERCQDNNSKHGATTNANNVDIPEHKTINAREETGYEILQIKSDSSLQTHKSSSGTRKSCNSTHNQHSRLRSNNTSITSTMMLTNASTTATSPSSLTSTSTCSPSTSLCSCTSSSTSCLSSLPPLLTQSTVQPTSLAKEFNQSFNCKLSTNANANANSKTSVQITVVSRPPSVSSEHELYYASLDLPPCTTSEINAKLNKLDNIAEPSAVVVTANATNSYAKIDFDHSDSSSSSSKNVMVKTNE